MSARRPMGAGFPGRAPIERRLADAGLPALPRMAWLEIDLEALAANLRLLRAAAGEAIPIRPVVKADAYGHGLVPVARALVAAGADGLCVATFDEALVLRADGLGCPILVLYPIPPAFAPEAARLGIDLTAGDSTLLAATLASLATIDGTTEGGPAPLAIELEVETGLGRGGFRGEDLSAAARAIDGTPSARLSGLWTHLQAPADPATTARQLARFEAATSDLRAAGIAVPERHATASTGLLADEVAVYGGVRPGLAVYGIVPDERPDRARPDDLASRLRPVLSLHARPVRVTELPAGWGISYGPSFVTARPSRIATLPIGYADGWSRSLSDRAEALVRGVRVPVVGRVAMDAIMLDVTEVPGDAVTPDDECTLIGSQGDQRITVADLAQVRTTIAWEVVSTMAGRLPRVYHAASGPVGLRTLTEWR